MASMGNDRASLAAITLVGLMLAAGTADPIAPPGGDGTYRYAINHSQHGAIGTHTVTVRSDGARRVLTSSLKIAVKMLMITIYRRTEDLTEEWVDGRLLRFDSRRQVGDDDPVIVTGRRRPDGRLMITSMAGEMIIPAEAVPGHSFHPSSLDGILWLDQDEAKLLEVQVSEPVSETLIIGDRTVDAQRFDITGDITRSQWYGTDGIWLRTQMENNGTVTIERVFD